MNLSKVISKNHPSAPNSGIRHLLNDQLVQYSGTVEPAALKSTTDSADRLAGKLRIDDCSAGGPTIDVEFDAPLLTSCSKAR